MSFPANPLLRTMNIFLATFPRTFQRSYMIKLHDKAEAVRALYSSKECLKQIVRKSGLSKRVDGSNMCLHFKRRDTVDRLKPSCRSQQLISSHPSGANLQLVNTQTEQFRWPLKAFVHGQACDRWVLLDTFIPSIHQ